MTPRTYVAARLRAIGRSAQRAGATVWPFLYGATADLIILLGIAAIAYGIGQLSKPAAWIFVGVVCVVIGVRGSQPSTPAGGEH